VKTCIKKLADIREFLAKDGPTSPEQFMKLMTLDNIVEQLRSWGDKTKSEVEAPVLADTKSRDVLLRYETTNERQLYRAISSSDCSVNERVIMCRPR
jgi:hypothetical protein